VAIGKEGIPEGPSKRMDQGKSSHASSVANQVTSLRIANRNDMAIRVLHEIIKDQLAPLVTIKTQCMLDKLNKKKKAPPLEWSTTEPHNNEQLTGYQELQMKMTM
jgi:hypothetical protein